MSTITTEEWMAELERVRQSDAGLTMAELSELWHTPWRTTQTILRKGLREGLYLRGTAYREDITGRMQRVPVYRVAKPTKGSKA